MTCPKCNHPNTIKKGEVTLSTGEKKQRFRCKNCGHNFYEEANAVVKQEQIEVPALQTILDLQTAEDYIRGASWFDQREAKRYVITSAQSDTPINSDFLGALETYCAVQDATLFIIPTRYKNPNVQGDVPSSVYPQEITKYLVDNNFKIHPKLKVLGSLKISLTSDDPLSGLSPISKGESIIIGHNQLQMQSVPVQINDKPVIMTTTGTISDKNYSLSKQGYKAEFNHSHSAVVVELDGDIFHLRHLNFDGVGFYDLEDYYESGNSYYVEDSVEAIVTGDEHAVFADKLVKNATYGTGGIVDTLRPNYIVRHDVLDCFAISHHHRNNFLLKYEKMINGTDDISKELKQTLDFVVETTLHGATNIFVPSNHTDHLTKWLNEADPKIDTVNARLYHWLMYNKLKSIEEGKSVDPFEMFATPYLGSRKVDYIFLNRNEVFKIKDVEVAIHGDKGNNGSRGTREQFANLSSKTIVGHSHSPGITKGCYQVGTSSILKMEYNIGPSSWMNTHCLIYKNGKRQLINIIDGKWRV